LSVRVDDLSAELDGDQAEAVQIYLRAPLEARRTGLAQNWIIGNMTDWTRAKYDAVMASIPKRWFEEVAGVSPRGIEPKGKNGSTSSV
jgi:hypothetical protein